MVYHTKDLQFAYKQIRLRKQNPAEAKKIAAEYNLHPISGRVLAARGYTADAALANYLDPTLKNGLPPPEKLLNLNKACDLIRDTIAAGSSIAICCDFDVDGLSGGAQVQTFFETIGVKSQVFVPDRFEDGYGLNERMIREIAANKFALVLTIDYGTTNTKELGLARSLGLKTIVIDHHHVGEHNPPCDIFINPQQKGCGFGEGILCASGLAWYLLVGLKTRLSNTVPAAKAVDVRSYLDLACLGTICDMVPLTGINRVLARRGLELLTYTKRSGLQAIKNTMNLHSDVSCHDVSFGMGPRLNAAGRMENAKMVIDLLTTKDAAVASKIARTLNDLNADRQATETEVKELALENLKRRYGGKELPWGIVVCDEEFHTGVIGIVAQRLVESFYRPTVVLGKDSEGVFKGSARGIKGFSVVDTFSACAEHLIKFGGHDGAGGCSVEADRLEDFENAFNEQCRIRLEGLEKKPSAEADAEITLSEMSVQLVDELQKFSPFGMGNPQPILLAKNLKVKDIRDIKGTHMKVALSDGKANISGMFWRQTSHPDIQKGATVNVAFKPDYSTFNGLTELQANVQAVQRA